MGSRGRTNVVELLTHPLDASARQPPPDELRPAEKDVWISVINAEAPDWFTPSNAPLLLQYCRHVVGAREVARRIDQCDPDDDYAYVKLMRTQYAESFAIMALCAKMRISQSSTINQRGNKKPRTAKASRQLYDR